MSEFVNRFKSGKLTACSDDGEKYIEVLLWLYLTHIYRAKFFGKEKNCYSCKSPIVFADTEDWLKSLCHDCFELGEKAPSIYLKLDDSIACEARAFVYGLRSGISSLEPIDNLMEDQVKAATNYIDKYFKE